MGDMNLILSKEKKLLEEKKKIEEKERDLRNKKKAIDRKLKSVEKEKEVAELEKNAKRNKQIADIVEQTYGTLEDISGFEEFMKENSNRNWEKVNLNPEL